MNINIEIVWKTFWLKKSAKLMFTFFLCKGPSGVTSNQNEGPIAILEGRGPRTTANLNPWSYVRRYFIMKISIWREMTWDALDSPCTEREENLLIWFCWISNTRYAKRKNRNFCWLCFSHIHVCWWQWFVPTIHMGRNSVYGILMICFLHFIFQCLSFWTIKWSYKLLHSLHDELLNLQARSSSFENF